MKIENEDVSIEFISKNKKEYNVDKVILGYVHDIGKHNGEFYGHVMREYRY